MVGWARVVRGLAGKGLGKVGERVMEMVVVVAG